MSPVVPENGVKKEKKDIGRSFGMSVVVVCLIATVSSASLLLELYADSSYWLPEANQASYKAATYSIAKFYTGEELHVLIEEGSTSDGIPLFPQWNKSLTTPEENGWKCDDAQAFIQQLLDGDFSTDGCYMHMGHQGRIAPYGYCALNGVMYAPTYGIYAVLNSQTKGAYAAASAKRQFVLLPYAKSTKLQEVGDEIFATEPYDKTQPMFVTSIGWVTPQYCPAFENCDETLQFVIQDTEAANPGLARTMKGNIGASVVQLLLNVGHEFFGYIGSYGKTQTLPKEVRLTKGLCTAEAVYPVLLIRDSFRTYTFGKISGALVLSVELIIITTGLLYLAQVGKWKRIGWIGLIVNLTTIQLIGIQSLIIGYMHHFTVILVVGVPIPILTKLIIITSRCGSLIFGTFCVYTAIARDGYFMSTFSPIGWTSFILSVVVALSFIMSTLIISPSVENGLIAFHRDRLGDCNLPDFKVCGENPVFTQHFYASLAIFMIGIAIAIYLPRRQYHRIDKTRSLTGFEEMCASVNLCEVYCTPTVRRGASMSS